MTPPRPRAAARGTTPLRVRLSGRSVTASITTRIEVGVVTVGPLGGYQRVAVQVDRGREFAQPSIGAWIDPPDVGSAKPFKREAGGSAVALRDGGGPRQPQLVLGESR